MEEKNKPMVAFEDDDDDKPDQILNDDVLQLIDQDGNFSEI